MTTEATSRRNAVKFIRVTVNEFLKLESASGIILIGVAFLAMIIANSPTKGIYESLLGTTVQIRIDGLNIEKPLILWINDGLMAIFFLLVGLELKREILVGRLSDRKKVILPGIAAIGGMAIPALIYVLMNLGNGAALNGWAIPAATDIAFALGILSLFGKRIPITVKVLLLAIAIFDDLGAIAIIALFYSGDLSWLAMGFALIFLLMLAAFNVWGVTRIAAYLLVGILLWVAVLKSGVHATLAGVAIALAIPLKARNEEGQSPLYQLEHALHPWVAFGILPLFAFANAGISLENLSLSDLLNPIPLGIMAGLFIGKQLGIFGFIWLSVKMGIAKLPEHVRWLEVYSVASLGGIGFTMSFFVLSLALQHLAISGDLGDRSTFQSARLAILIGSLVSAIWAYGVIAFSVSKRPEYIEEA